VRALVTSGHQCQHKFIFVNEMILLHRSSRVAAMSLLTKRFLLSVRRVCRTGMAIWLVNHVCGAHGKKM
jgi:hypothetical protein